MDICDWIIAFRAVPLFQENQFFCCCLCSCCYFSHVNAITPQSTHTLSVADLILSESNLASNIFVHVAVSQEALYSAKRYYSASELLLHS